VARRLVLVYGRTALLLALSMARPVWAGAVPSTAPVVGGSVGTLVRDYVLPRFEQHDWQ